ncbi:MAG: hypothetical protein AAF969_01545 [Bacteroidota bacterium]
MGDKINVKQMLEQAILENVDTHKETEELKQERNSGIFGAASDRNTEEKLEGGGRKTALRDKKLSAHNRKKVDQFLQLMEMENYVDKKEQFIFRLSNQCFTDYEKLTNVYNYKMGKKATRNDIMRKVLELFHSQYIPELIKNMERL